MTIEVAGREVEMEVNTGASVSVVPTQMYNEVLSRVQLKKSTAQLQSYRGEWRSCCTNQVWNAATVDCSRCE